MGKANKSAGGGSWDGASVLVGTGVGVDGGFWMGILGQLPNIVTKPAEIQPVWVLLVSRTKYQLPSAKRPKTRGSSFRRKFLIIVSSLLESGAERKRNAPTSILARQGTECRRLMV